MKRLLIVVCFLVCGMSRAEPLSPSAFTHEFARALTAAMPSATVKVDGELRLSIKDASGRERMVFLSNPYQEYALDSQRFDDIVKRFAVALLQSDNPHAKLDRSRIVPVIKDRKWLADLRQTLKAQGKEQEHLSESFNDDLIIVYAEDDPARMRYLTADEDIGISRPELRALAIENLRRILPKIELRSGDHILLVSAGGDYEPSLLLIDEIWSGGQIKVKGDIVVAIPARDALLVTGSRDRTGVRRMRELAAKLAAEGPYGLTDALFVYRNGLFTKFGRN
jgi:uncharacterized protein YtpQ (UPF0354 family)